MWFLYFQELSILRLKPVGEQFVALCFHLPPPLKPLLISPQARISLLLLLFHLLIHDRPLYPCCGPTCHVKNLLHRKKISTGNSGLRTSYPAGPQHMLTLSAPLVEASILLLQSRHFCKKTGILKHTCWKGEYNLLIAMFMNGCDVFCLLSPHDVLGHPPATISLIIMSEGLKEEPTEVKNA